MHNLTSFAWISVLSFLAGMISLLFSVFFISNMDSEVNRKK